MADNVLHPLTGAGTADVTQATDDISGVHYVKTKVVDATDGSTIGMIVDADGRAQVNIGTMNRVSITPTIATAAYVTGDQLGGVMTFTSMALSNGGQGQVINVVVTNRGTQNPIIELWLFRVSPTMVNADGGAFDITDANLEAGEIIGIIDVVQWYTIASGAVSHGQLRGQGLAGSPMPYVCGSSTTSIFGIMCTRSSWTAGAASDVVVTVTAVRD